MTEMGLFSTNLSNTSPSMAGLLSGRNCRRPIVPNLALPLNRWGVRCMKLCALAVSIILLGMTSVASQTLDEINNDGKNTDNVLTYGMGYHQNRYSTLKQVNKQTVQRLVPVWNVAMSSNYGEQAQPFVYNGVLFVTNAEFTVAIDVESGKQLWRMPVTWDPATPRIVCCGVSNKGPALYNGKVFRGTLDAFVVALDQKTGQEVWKQKAANWQQGYSITTATLAANGA